MNLVADESIDSPIVLKLRDDGHDVYSIAEQSPGVSDDEVLLQANSQSAVLLTGDKDFGELEPVIDLERSKHLVFKRFVDSPAATRPNPDPQHR